MPSTINSDDGQTSGSAGLKFTSADDGILQIQNNGNTAMTVSAAGVTTFASQPVVPVPAFSVIRTTSTHNLSQNNAAKIQFNSIISDTNSWFDPTTNHRYTPQIAGYYYFFGQAFFTSSGATIAQPLLYKNGAQVLAGSFFTHTSSTTVVTPPIQQIVYMNGSTDYMELFVFTNGANPVAAISAPANIFSGFLVRAA
jgi:hypothetical protein